MTTRSAGDRHGDLPDTLRAAAAAVIVDNGLGGFSLREVARRAGVSHAAPGYHFGDSRGLLTSLAAEGFRTLSDEMAAALEGLDDPVARLTAIGRAYVRVGREYPAHCQVIFRNDVIDPADPELEAAGVAAYATLEDAVRAIAERHHPDLDVTDGARLCWSAMQGLVVLQGKFEDLDRRAGREIADIDTHVERFTALLLDGLLGTDAPG